MVRLFSYSITKFSNTGKSTILYWKSPWLCFCSVESNQIWFAHSEIRIRSQLIYQDLYTSSSNTTRLKPFSNTSFQFIWKRFFLCIFPRWNRKSRLTIFFKERFFWTVNFSFFRHLFTLKLISRARNAQFGWTWYQMKGIEMTIQCIYFDL